MDFVNNFKNMKKMEINMYQDFEEAWAEYEFICTTMKARITEIITNNASDCIVYIIIKDNEIRIEISKKNNDLFYIDSNTLKKLDDYLGIQGKISVIKKKNPCLLLIYSKEEVL